MPQNYKIAATATLRKHADLCEKEVSTTCFNNEGTSNEPRTITMMRFELLSTVRPQLAKQAIETSSPTVAEQKKRRTQGNTRPLCALYAPSMPLCALYAPTMRPQCALYAPSMRPLCAHYAPSMRPLCALYAPSMRPLCALSAPSTRPLCAHYAPTMRPLCALYAPTMMMYFVFGSCLAV